MSKHPQLNPFWPRPLRCRRGQFQHFSVHFQFQTVVVVVVNDFEWHAPAQDDSQPAADKRISNPKYVGVLGRYVALSVYSSLLPPQHKSTGWNANRKTDSARWSSDRIKCPFRASSSSLVTSPAGWLLADGWLAGNIQCFRPELEPRARELKRFCRVTFLAASSRSCFDGIPPCRPHRCAICWCTICGSLYFCRVEELHRTNKVFRG